MSEITREQFIDALVKQHRVSREDAKRAADRKFGPVRKVAPCVTPTAAVAIALPLRLTLPWSALVSDNLRHTATIRPQADGKQYPLIVLTGPYREAKAKARKIARELVNGADPLPHPLALEARVWVPNHRPGHDVCNFAKCAHDAFEGVLYEKDEQLHAVRWIRAGVDVDAPRADITISPYLSTTETP